MAGEAENEVPEQDLRDDLHHLRQYQDLDMQVWMQDNIII